jgi:dTDP-4-amino-4,6-dideoxygalactose transaminase
MDIAAKHKLKVIEDACHGHGAEYKGKKLGSIGDAGCFSFQSSKNLTSGEGGMVITNDEKLYDMMNSLRNVGRVKGGQWYEHHYLGCNYRMTQLQAVLLLSQLKRLDMQTLTRHENGTYLNSFIYSNTTAQSSMVFPNRNLPACLRRRECPVSWDIPNRFTSSLCSRRRISCATLFLKM